MINPLKFVSKMFKSANQRELDRLKKIADSWYKHQIIINYELVTRKKFSQYIKDEKLILKPFDLRRDKLYSLAVWILILLRTLKN